MASSGAGQARAAVELLPTARGDPQPDRMLRDRLVVSIVLIPVVLGFVRIGGVVYLVGVLIILTLAVLEYVRMFRQLGLQPSRPLLLGGVAGLSIVRYAGWPHLEIGALALLIVAALAWHLVDYERGAPTSGTDFAVTLGGTVYLGELGAFFVSLRQIPDGLWWTLLILPTVWLADSGAYAIGRRFGRHRMVPRLSPRKTWEGFVGGVVGGALGGGLLGSIWSIGAGPASAVNGFHGLILGMLIGMLSPIGDLGVSMIKRQIGTKDSGHLLAGHGGALDRMDSWLVAVVIGYYGALWLMG